MTDEYENACRKQYRAREVEIVREDILNVRTIQREHERALRALHDRMAEKDKQYEQLQAKMGEVLVSLEKAREVFKGQQKK